MPTRRMVPPAATVAVGVLILTVGAAVLLGSRHRTPARASGPLPQGAYVWQRSWGEPVTAALRQAAGQAKGFTVLAAEVSWAAGQARVARVPLDYRALRATHRPVGLALRIGPCPGPFDSGGEATALIAGLAREVIAEGRAGGLDPAELQVDFDCAASKLAGYREWAKALRTAAGVVPLTITVLPSWLKERAFPDLARATDGYVLQVHSLALPAGPDVPMSLCDPTAARRWVDEAAEIGVPFRVALPTYSYVAAFGKSGTLIAVSAEGPSRAWDQSVALRVVRSDAAAMARLVQEWQRGRPSLLKGIIWYRLPVEGDHLNWKWQTLATVMAGETPRQELRVEVVHPQPELAEIVLVNAGLTDIPPRVRVDLAWESGELIGADGLRGYALKMVSPTRAQLDPGHHEEQAGLAPGERWQIGWMRFKEKAEVRGNVARLQP